MRGDRTAVQGAVEARGAEATTDSRAVVRYEGTGLDRARGWSEMPEGDRRRRAMAAAQTHDTAALLGLAESWLLLYGRRKKATSPLTVAAYRQGIAALIEAWRARGLLKASGDDAALWLASLTNRAGEDAAPATRVRYRAAGRALYAALRWAGATDANPFKDAAVEVDPTPAQEKRAAYTMDEITRLVTCASGDDRALVLLGAHAGLRVSEMLTLRWADVDLPARSLVVRAGKGSKRRTVQMSATLCAALADLRVNGERTVGPRADHVLPYKAALSARRRLAALCARADVAARGVHSLRHSAGTRLYAETQDLQEVAGLLGHSGIATALIYAKRANDRQRQVMDTW